MKKTISYQFWGFGNCANISKKIFLALILLISVQILRAQTPWYYNGTGPINDVASWGTNPNGTGGTLADFTSGGRLFYIQNTTAVTLTGTWNVGNTFFGNAGGDSVIIGNHNTPVAPITFTLSAGSAFVVTTARTVAVANPLSGTNKIVYQNATPISFGLIADLNLELVYDNTTITTSTSSSFGNVSVINNASVNMGGAAIIVRNLTVDAGSTLIGPIGASSNYIGVKTTGIVTINGTFRAGRTGGLFTASNNPFPTTGTTFGTILFQDAVTPGTNLILGPNSTIDYNRGTSGQTGIQTITALNYANLSLTNSALASNKAFPATGIINVGGTMTVNLIGAATVSTPAATFTLNILPSGRFVINSATIYGSAGGNQRLFLKSDATGTASLGTMFAGSSFAGSINVEKFIPGGFRKNRFLSHPFTASQPLSEITGEIDITGNPAGTTSTVTGQTTGTGFTSTSLNNPSAYYFNTATSNGASPNDAGWLAFTDNTTTTNWPRGRGIRVLVRGTKGQANTLDGTDATPNPVTLTLNGTANVGAVAVPMLNSGTGLNLMGNPYASAVDIGAVLTAATPGTNVANAFYLRNPQTESFITVSPIPASYIIPAFSAFFVQALTASSLNFAEGNKSTCVSCPTVFRNSNTANIIELKAFKDGLEYDNLIFNFSDNSKTNNAVKLMNNGFSFYALSPDNTKLSATSVSLVEAKKITIGISLPKTKGIQTYTLKATQFSVPNNKKLVLHDKLMNKYISLQTGTTFNLMIDPLSKESVGENRLELIIEN